jgi:hypothetical protein
LNEQRCSCAWPAEMRAERAAGYCDEPSVASFLQQVARGIYPPPLISDCDPKWHRTRLDAAIDARHGLSGCAAPDQDVVDLI